MCRKSNPPTYEGALRRHGGQTKRQCCPPDVRMAEPGGRPKNYYLGYVALFRLTSLFCGLAPRLGLMLFPVGCCKASLAEGWHRSAR